MIENESPFLNITDTVSWRDRWWLLDVETSGLDRLAALLLGCSPRQRTDQFLRKFPSPNGLCGATPQNPDPKKLYALSLAVFHVLEETYRIQNTVELTDFYERGDKYDPIG